MMVDVREAAGLASRTPETIRRWVWSGRLEARRQGRRLLVARDDVLRLSGQPANSGPELTLREWATQARRSRGAQGGGAKTASDLVLADRGARSAGGGARDALRQLPITLVDEAADRDRAWDLSRRYDEHPLYDMLYAALAERLRDQLFHCRREAETTAGPSRLRRRAVTG